MADIINQIYSPSVIDPSFLIDEYLDGATWRIRENSTSSWSVNGLNNHIVGANISSYWLNKIYTPEIANAHRSCDLHLHDLGQLMAYCFDRDKEFLLANGEKMSFAKASEIGLTEVDVLSLSDEGKVISKHATDIGCKGIDDLYQIELEDGTILKGFTKWHEFKTRNRGMVRADELTEEDDIIEFHELNN